MSNPYPHKDTVATVHLEQQGELVALAMKWPTDRENIGGKRGAVTVFSKASRRRLFRKFARLRRVRTTFVTLTYPAEFPDPMTAKDNMRAFLERVRRKFPDASGIWRMEYQTRGAVHFHFLFFNMGYWHWKEVRKAWQEILGLQPGDPLFTDIRLCRSYRGAKNYLSKYIAKNDQTEDEFLLLLSSLAYPHAGRFWGVFNKGKLPYAEQQYLIVTMERMRGIADAKKLLRRYYPGISRRKYNGGVVLSSRAPPIFRALLDLIALDLSQNDTELYIC